MDTTRAHLQVAPPVTQAKPGAFSQARGALVVMGPSLVLLLGLAASLVATFLLVGVPSMAAANGPLRALAAGGVTLLGVLLIARSGYLRWGASDRELDCTLPGDALLPRPIAETTRAITIAASARDIWPWLAQMGRGRGGLYSYDWLENLAGLGIHSVDRIVPALQTLAVGDPVPLGPGPNNGFLAAQVEPDRALVLRLCDPQTGGFVDHAQPRYMDVVWAFVLQPIDEGTTRLIVRFLVGGRPRRPLAMAYGLLIELPHFVMERKMMLGIRRRAERARRAA